MSLFVIIIYRRSMNMVVESGRRIKNVHGHLRFVYTRIHTPSYEY